MKKWIFTQYNDCVNKHMVKSFTLEDAKWESKDSSGTTKNVTGKLLSNNLFKESGDELLPSYKFQHSIDEGSSPKVNCFEILNGVGNNKLKGALSYAGSGWDASFDWSCCD